MINPQEEKTKKIIDMYDNGCVCNYKNNKYKKGIVHLTHCVVFTNPSTHEENVVGFIYFEDVNNTVEIDIKIEGDSLSFSDR